MTERGPGARRSRPLKGPSEERRSSSGAAWSHAKLKFAAARFAAGGHLECLRWARQNGCPWDAATCVAAAFPSSRRVDHEGNRSLHGVKYRGVGYEGVKAKAEG